MSSWRPYSALGAGAVAALALAGCGSSSSSKSTGTAATPPPAAANVVPVSADPTGKLRFATSTLHAKAGTVTVSLTNPTSSGIAHGVAVQGHGVDKDSKIVQAGGQTSVTVTLKPGTYSFYCPVPGHEAAGMKGTLVVS